MILGIDTSGQNLGLALVAQGRPVATRLYQPEKGHGPAIQPAVNELFADCGLSLRHLKGIAIVLGPGSFTGLRVGMAAAKGYSYGLKIPLTGVSSLWALAWHACDRLSKVAAVIDAKRGEVYWVVFYCQGVPPAPLSDERVGPPEDLGELGGELLTLLGPAHLSDRLLAIVPGAEYRNSDDLNLAVPAALAGEADLRAGRVLDVSTVGPHYLRRF